MKIYIGNLPYGGQIKEDVQRLLDLPCGSQIKEDVQRLFSRYGEAWGCVIIKTYGFIHMEKEDGNEAIKQLDGYMLEGKRMRVEKSRGRLEMFNPVFDGNYCRFGGLRPSDYENNCNNVLAPFNSARDNCLNQLGDFNCNRMAGAGLGKPVCDHSFMRRMAISNVFRDSGLYGLGNSVGNCSGDNLARLSNAVGDHNCNMLGGCNIANDGRFSRMGAVGNTVGDHSCNFNGVCGNRVDGFGDTFCEDMYTQGGYGCAVKKYNSDRLSAFRNTVSDNSYEGMGGIVVEEEKVHLSDSAIRESGDVDIKMKIAQLNRSIKTEESKPLINERDVNDWRNQVNYLERKIKHLETEKTEFNLRRQVQYLQKRVRDLQEEKKVYMDQELNDHGGRSLSDYQTNLRSSKAGKRVRPPTPESSSKKSTTIRHAKNKRKYETENMSDDDIQVIDASDDEDDIKIVDEREEEDVKFLSESKLKEDRISKNEVELTSVNVSKRPKSLTKDGSKNRMRSEKFDEEGDWGVVKSERCNDGDVPLIYLDDEKDFANESIVKNSSVKDDQKMQNMSDGLGEVLDDENLIQGVPPLDQVLARFRCSHTPTQ